MKHVKRVIAIIVALAVAVGFMPAAPVNADGTEFDLWVNGQQFTDSVTEIACGSGTATYDSATNTLTLDNAEITSAYSVPGGPEEFMGLAQVYIGIPGLTIKLKGSNTFTAYDEYPDDPYNEESIGIVSKGGCNIVIDGEKDASLSITGGPTAIRTYGNGNVYEGGGIGSVTIKGGVSVTLNPDYYGIISNEGIDITDSTVEANAGNDGILCVGDLNISGSTVKVSGTDSYGSGISVMDGMMNINNSTVNVTAAMNAISFPNSGQPVKGISVEGSTLTLKVTGTPSVDSIDSGYGIMIQPEYVTGEDGNDHPVLPNTFGSISIGTSTIIIDSPNGGTNLDDSKITIGSGTTYKKGTSINDKGEVELTVTGPASSGSTPTPTPTPTSSPSAEPTPGGDSTPAPSATPTSGNNDGNGNGNGDGSNSNVPRDQQKGEDGTELGKGAAAEQVDKFLTSYDSEADAPGSIFRVLQAKSTKTAKNSITVTWKKAPGAVKYLVYASKCGKGNKPIKMDETTKTKYTLKKLNGKKISKGTYYKFIIVAVDSNNNVVSSSKTIHSATLGGKVGNCKSISTKAKKNKVSIKAKKTFKLKPKQKAQKKKLKIKNHRKLMYESSDESIATVNKSGVIKGVSKGTCEVYVFAQNGVFQKIKVTVK